MDPMGHSRVKEMLVAKIEGHLVKLFEGSTGVCKRVFNCSNFKGAKSAEITGDMVAIACGDGKTRIYDANNGVLKRTI